MLRTAMIEEIKPVRKKSTLVRVIQYSAIALVLLAIALAIAFYVFIEYFMPYPNTG